MANPSRKRLPKVLDTPQYKSFVLLDFNRIFCKNVKIESLWINAGQFGSTSPCFQKIACVKVGKQRKENVTATLILPSNCLQV